MQVLSLKRLLNFGLLLAVSVVILGAYTRLTDAGLGCPDWPGCYGHMLVPQYRGVEHIKAWTEMVHRYCAGGLLCLVILILIQLIRDTTIRTQRKCVYGITLCMLLLFQAALGMWTVTLKLLPWVVTGHLLGGMLIVSVLMLLRVQLLQPSSSVLQDSAWSGWIRLGVMLTVLQITLGAWVSSNYAAISCIGFPLCNGLWVPPLNFAQAFNVFQTIGPNYQGGLLDVDARMTIQWVHRIVAVIVYLFWGLLWLVMFRAKTSVRLSRTMFGLFLLLTCQMMLGIFNVTHGMPLFTAVLHNGVAAVALAVMMMLIGFTREAGTVHA